MASPYRIALTEEQRAELRGLVGSGRASARMLTRARILLKADHGEGGPGWSDAAIVGALDVNASTVLRVRRHFVTDGLAATLERKRPDRIYDRTLDGAQEARLIAIACSETPEGADHWSLRLLADELVRVEVVATISHETVRQTLKKTRSSRGWSSRGASRRPPIPPLSGTWRMCWMSSSAPTIRSDQWCASMRRAGNCWATSAHRCALAQGHPAHHDPESVRGGVANLFMVTEPLRGWRAVTVSDQRTRLDFAGCLKEVVDVHYPEAERIVLVLDHLNTHSPASR